MDYKNKLEKNRQEEINKRLVDHIDNQFFENLEYFRCILKIFKEISIIHNGNVTLNGKFNLNNIFFQVENKKKLSIKLNESFFCIFI